MTALAVDTMQGFYANVPEKHFPEAPLDIAKVAVKMSWQVCSTV